MSRARAFHARARKGARLALAGLALGAFITSLLASILYLPNYVVARDLGVEDKRTVKAIRTEEKDLVEAKNQVRTTLLQAMGGIFLSATAYFTWRQIRQGREGQITERFTKAIEHLGKKDDLDIRLGGIHALERIGRDSKSDRAAIVDILSAYIRGHAPWQEPASKEPSSGGLLYDAQGNKAPAVRLGEVSQPSEPRPLQARAPDVQAALDALTRSSLRSGHDEPIEMAMTDLRRAVLRGAHLAGAVLRGAHLTGADLREAHLAGADLREAHLAGSVLIGAHLEDATLWGAHLEDATLWEAHLEGAVLIGAHLEGAHLKGAHLEGTHLEGTHLEGAHLKGAHLKGATLWGAHLEGAILFGAHLEGAILRKALANKDTEWPDGFDHHTAGVIMVDAPEAEAPSPS